MRLHCIATNSWGQVPSKFSRANAAGEAVKQIQKGKENPWSQKVVCRYKSHAQQPRELFLGFGACFLSCTVTAEWIMYRSNSVLFCITLSL